MNNAEGTTGVPLTVFGGAVPEMAPEDLPEGASPWNQDVDYSPGSVFTRGGRVTQYTYQNLFLNPNTTLAKSIPGQFAPTEVAWQAPANATLATPGTYTTAQLNQGVNISNILQYKQVMINTSGTTFTAAFDAPVTAGSCVFIALFVHDPNGVAEGVNCTACIDNKAQNADYIVANITSPNNVNVAFAILYKSAVGGNQTYTFTIRTNASGTVTASNYAYCLCEVINTANSAGADPKDQLFAVTATTAQLGQSTQTTVTTAQANELFIGVTQVTDATWNGFLMPGVFYTGTPTSGMRIINDIENSSGNYREQALAGTNLPSNPAGTLAITNSGNVTGVDSVGAWVTLKMTNTNAVGVNGLLPFGVDATASNTSTGGTTISFPSITTNQANEFIFYQTAFTNNFGYPTVTPPLGYVGSSILGGSGSLYGLPAPTAGTYSTAVVATIPGGNSTPGLSGAFSIPAIGIGGPNIIQTTGTGSVNNGTQNLVWSRPLTAGSTVLVLWSTGAATVFGGYTPSNSNNDGFSAFLNVSASNGGGATMGIFNYIAQNVHGGNTDMIITAGSNQGGAIIALEIAAGSLAIQPTPHSQVLQASKFGLNLAASQVVLGMAVQVYGHQNTQDASAQITVSVQGQTAAPTFTTQLPGADAGLTFGGLGTIWGFPLTAAVLNNPSFSINVVASSNVAATFQIYAVRLYLWLTPNPPANFNYLKTYEQTDGEVDTLALDSNGILWDEDVDSLPTVLTSIYQNILPNTFAKSVTFSDIEYIAFSNLVNGTDVPRQWNGTNLDRISMVGPGAALSAAAQSGAGAIQTITQTASVQIRRIAWGASANAINDSTPGNVLVVFGEGRTGSNTYQTLAPYSTTFGAGTTVVLSGIPNPFPKKDGGTIPFNINGTYTVLSVTTAVVGGSEICPVFTIQAPGVAYGYSSDFGSGGTPTSGWFYQSTVATLTSQVPVPNLQVGGTLAISGTGGSPPAGYDGNFTVIQTPNAAQVQITATVLSGNIATYSFLQISGAAPHPGQFITVANTLNGNGIFNVSQVAITAASGGGSPGAGGSFSVGISHVDISSANESGDIPQAVGTIAGTIFLFDPLQVVGNKTGGSIVTAGLIAAGIRKVSYSFLTRSGFITQPAPLYTANIISGSSSILVTGLLTGPPNVVARIVMFTGANGGNFFYIPQPVTVQSGGQTIINTSTIVNDNTSTSATFSFSDAVLLTGLACDIPGNNLFNCIELGSCRGLLTYATRLFAWSEQAKITNLRNMSFDGGIGGSTSSGGTDTTSPAGWNVDPTNGGGGGIQNSLVFGKAYVITNTSGSTQSVYGMITQNAYQDEFGVPIVNASTLYSVRVTAYLQAITGSGNLVVDLYSPKQGVALGTFSIPLSSLSANQQIFTGTLLTSLLQPVPGDLQIRVWAQNILNNTTVFIDRIEPFPTLAPVISTAFKASYAGNQEAFDLQTGVSGPSQNQQPINGGMVLFDLLYALKERSWYSTNDNGVTEPFKWNWKEVSAKVGTIGINSYDSGEGWALTANREGVFFFEGGEPLKISEEIQPLWDLINWKAGYTIWLRNDPEQRRFTIGVPISTPNAYMPEFPVNTNPTSPNVILMCNYRELSSGAAVAQTAPIRSTFQGRLMAPEPARKWSFWNIACPYSDYIDRADNTWPQFFGTGYTDYKIFALSASQLSDDGAAINSFYITYGWVKPEMADAKGLGLFRMEMPYMTILAVGSGTLNTYVYPESPSNPPYALDQQTLPAVTQGDIEIAANVKGQRFFIRFGTNAVGAAFRVSKIVVPLLPDTWSPIRGYNAVTA